MSMNVGGSTSRASESGKTEPWAPQQPYLLRGFQDAYGDLSNGPRQYFPGSTVAPRSDLTTEGMNTVADTARTNALPGTAAGQLGATASGAYLDTPGGFASQMQAPDVGTNPNATAWNSMAEKTNPYLDQNPNAYIDNVTNSIERSVVPRVQSQYATAGRTGTSAGAQQAMAKGIADALAPYQFGSAEAEMGRRFAGGESAVDRLYGAGESQTARMFGAGESALDRSLTQGENAFTRGAAAYDAERQRQLQAAGLTPAINEAQYSGGDRLLGLGAMDEDLAQRQLSDEVARHDFGQAAPYEELARYMDLIQGNYGSVFSGKSSGSGAQAGFKTGK